MATEQASAEGDSAAEKQDNSKRKMYIIQVVGLVALLFILMTTSVVTTLMATGIIDISQQTDGPANSMTDAQFICAKALKAEHGGKMQSFALDDHSSRGDESGGYKMFYELNMFRGGDRNSGVTKFYVNCFVTSSGRVRRLDLFEEKPYVPKAGKRSHGNAFGL